MHALPRALLLAACVLLADASTAWAGMPTITLTDIAKVRIQNLSFFLVAFLLAALGIRWIWNALSKDFSALPRLSYLKALGVMTLWGLLFVLVLTMISGARELLTPGAWQRDGWTYQLPAPPPGVGRPEVTEEVRREKLLDLRFALWEYARTHDGAFPAGPTDPALAAERWEVPDGSGMRYIYFENPEQQEGTCPLALEPETLGKERFVLFTDGAVRRLTGEDIDRLLKEVSP